MKALFYLMMLFAPSFIIAQNVGIGNPAPTEKLDVNGNFNLNGKLKVNGTAGQPNQVLMTNTGGATVWQNFNAFSNFIVFTGVTEALSHLQCPPVLQKCLLSYGVLVPAEIALAGVVVVPMRQLSLHVIPDRCLI